MLKTDNALLDAMPFFIFSLTKKGVFDGCNSTFAQKMGLVNASEIKGIATDTLCPDENLRKAYAKDREEVIKSLQPITVCERIIVPTQELDCLVYGQLMPRFNDNFDVTGVVAAVRHIANCDQKKVYFPINGNQYELTWREVHCLQLLIYGTSAREAGEILFISPKTVESHWLALRQKFGDLSRSDLVMLFLSLGITKLIPASCAEYSLL